MLIALIVWRGIIGWYADLKPLMDVSDTFAIATPEEVALYRKINDVKI